MLFRLLLVIVLMAPMAFGQGIFGTSTGHPKAGDAAPELVFQEVLSAPAAGAPSRPNLSGQVTVLGFFPDTSHNPKPVADWNTRVDQYALRHVQFVWITGEDKRTLMLALVKHPIKGWVLYDPEGATAKAFGLDMPVNVYIGANRKIVGFQQGYIPDEPTLNAVLDRRVVLERPTPATVAFREDNLVALDSAPARMPRAEDYRPHFAPSYTVHIMPSTAGRRGNFGADGYWVLQGVTVKEAVEELYDVNSVRVDLPAPANAANRYDFAAVLPQAEDRAEMKERFKQAMLEYFHLSISHEPRLTDVYVVSVEAGRRPPVERTSEFGGSRSSSVGLSVAGGWGQSMEELRPESLDALTSISERGTMDELCRDLEGSLDRPVVNETNLEGRYRIEVQLPVDPKASFLTMLRERTGLVIRPGQRKITFLKFRDER